MQQAFFDFFSSNSSNDDVNSDSDFPSVFIEELEKTLTEMLNYAFVVC